MLPLLACARTLVFAFLRILVLPFSVTSLSLGKTPSDQLHIWLRRRDPVLGLLLKHVQNVDRVREISGIDGPEGIASVALNDLHDPRSSETFQRLRGRIRIALLS